MAVATNTLASMLTPVENFQQRRQDRLNEANFTAQITQNKLFQQQQLAQERAFAEQQLAQLKSLNVEDEDRLRIDNFLSNIEKGIQDKIKKNYNNPIDYIRTEFQRDLSLMKDALLSSDVYKNAIHNKTVMDQIRKDKEKGLVSMGSMSQAESGISINPIEKQLLEYRSGVRDRLEYGGSYKISDDYVKAIRGRYGNDRFTKQQATPDEVIAEMRLSNQLDSNQAIYEYYRSALDKSPLFYKVDDAYEKEKMQLDRAVAKSRIAANNSQTKLNTAQMRYLDTLPVDTFELLKADVKASASQGSDLKRAMADSGRPVFHATNISSKQYRDLAGLSPSFKVTKDGIFLNRDAEVRVATGGRKKDFTKNYVNQLMANQPVQPVGLVVIGDDLYMEVNADLNPKYVPKGMGKWTSAGVKTFPGAEPGRESYTNIVKTQNKNTYWDPGAEDRYRAQGLLVKIDANTLSRQDFNKNSGSINQRTLNTFGQSPF